MLLIALGVLAAILLAGVCYAATRQDHEAEQVRRIWYMIERQPFEPYEGALGNAVLNAIADGNYDRAERILKDRKAVL